MNTNESTNNIIYNPLVSYQLGQLEDGTVVAVLTFTGEGGATQVVEIGLTDPGYTHGVAELFSSAAQDLLAAEIEGYDAVAARFTADPSVPDDASQLHDEGDPS